MTGGVKYGPAGAHLVKAIALLRRTLIHLDTENMTDAELEMFVWATVQTLHESIENYRKEIQ